MSDEWRDDPYMRELARELRERLGDEFREDAEDAEELAARWFARSRTLVDVAGDLRSRGDLVAVDVGGQVFTGRLVYVADDYVTLETPAARVEIGLDARLAFQVVERATSGGTGAQPGPATLRARLLELEMERVEIELATNVFDIPIRGIIEATAKDHIVFRSQAGEQWFVPLPAIRYVVTR